MNELEKIILKKNADIERRIIEKRILCFTHICQETHEILKRTNPSGCEVKSFYDEGQTIITIKIKEDI